jgi:hypothetical protein
MQSLGELLRIWEEYITMAALQFAHKLEALSLLPMPDAIRRLTSYKVDFVDRFGDVLVKSINSHRRRRPRIV